MFTDGRQMPSDGNTNVAHQTWRVRWAKKGENDKQWIHVGKISHPDFGYPVLALWFSNSYTLLNYLAFQSLLTSSIADENYSRTLLCSLQICTQEKLWQKLCTPGCFWNISLFPPQEFLSSFHTTMWSSSNCSPYTLYNCL